MEPNPDFETEQESIVEASAPPPVADTADEVPAETIEISAKERVLPHVKPQESKYWHFTLEDANKNQLTKVLQSVPGYNLTVEYGVPQNTPDITLKMNGETVGKIHLLLCDRRDANLPEKYYCKLYFYHFKKPELFQAVKTSLVNFFENFKPVTGGKHHRSHRKQRTHKKRRVIRRKKTARRN
jgi:hypothetical protein